MVSLLLPRLASGLFSNRRAPLRGCRWLWAPLSIWAGCFCLLRSGPSLDLQLMLRLIPLDGQATLQQFGSASLGSAVRAKMPKFCTRVHITEPVYAKALRPGGVDEGTHMLSFSCRWQHNVIACDHMRDSSQGFVTRTSRLPSLSVCRTSSLV